MCVVPSCVWCRGRSVCSYGTTSSVSQYVSESDSGTCEPHWGAALNGPPAGVVGKRVCTCAAGVLQPSLQQLCYLFSGSVTFYPRLLKQPLTEGARFGVPCAQSVPLQSIRFFSLQPSGSDGRFNSGRLLTLPFFVHGSSPRNVVTLPHHITHP